MIFSDGNPVTINDNKYVNIFLNKRYYPYNLHRMINKIILKKNVDFIFQKIILFELQQPMFLLKSLFFL